MNSRAVEESSPWVGLSHMVTEARVAICDWLDTNHTMVGDTHTLRERYTPSLASTDTLNIFVADFGLESMLYSQ
jgi:hypothetical protein